MTKLRLDTGFNRPIGAYCFFIMILNSPKAGQFGYSHSIPQAYGKIIKYECEPTEGAHVELQKIKF